MTTEPKLKTNWLYVAIIIFATLFVTAGILIYQKWSFKETENNKVVHGTCLADNEIVDYTINWRQVVGPVDIIVKKQQSNKEIFRFTVDSVFSGAYPVQPRKCGVYMLRFFNYDPQKSKQSPGYKEEIWYYSYNGEGRPFLLLGMKDDLGNFHNFFSLEFKIDFSEVYLALIKGYLGKIDYATVIKEIKTKEDVFELLLKDITNKYPSLEGGFGLRGWTKDSRYLWGHISMGAYVLGFFRVDTRNWNTDIFETPEGVGGGDALNVENGYITVHPGNVWIGIAEMNEEEKARRRKQGIGTELYVESLFTGERYLVDKASEPLWYFKPKWISDTELEYELPNGEKKIYNIENK